MGTGDARRRQWIASLVLCAVGVAIAAQSTRLRLGTWEEPGAGFFPFWSGVLIAGLSFTTALKTFFGPVVEAQPWSLRERWPHLVLAVGLLLAYSLALERLGFVLSTFFLLVGLFRLMGAGRASFMIAGSAAIAVVVYTVFKGWLGLQLPPGPLGF